MQQESNSEPSDMSYASKCQTVPIDWVRTTLGSIITLQRGHDLPTEERKPGNIPIIGANGITGCHNEAKAKGPGVAMGRSGTLGKVYFVESDYWPLNTSLYVKEFRSVDPKFIFYFLHTLDYRKYNAGSTVPTMNRNFLHPVQVIVPVSLREQRKIAEILSKVDDLIQKTDEIIGQTQRLKKGLMQSLLTKGIGHTHFKSVQTYFDDYGEIPEDWEMQPLEKYLTLISGDYFAYEDFVSAGIRVLKIDNVMYDYINWENTTYLPETFLDSHKDLILCEGDIVLALNRPITNNQVKVAKLSRADVPAILYQRVGKVKLKDREVIDGGFLFWLFSSNIFKMHLRRILIGSDQPYVKTTELVRQRFAFPKLEEQRRISSIITTINSEIELQVSRKRALTDLKKGLMQKLLTGQIRVKV